MRLKTWNKLHKKGVTAAIALALCSVSFASVQAMPTGGNEINGSASIGSETVNADGTHEMTITQSGKHAAINWDTFNLGKNDIVNFKQDADAIVLNQILDNNASDINGHINAPGTVFLLNPHGIVFGSDARLEVGSLIASTAALQDDAKLTNWVNNLNAPLTFTVDASNGAAITNNGVINAVKNEGGMVVLHAANVTNKGTITTGSTGEVQLAAVQTMNYADGKVTFDVDKSALNNANVLNAGTISAQNGYIALTARGADKVLASVVNNTGARLEATGLTKDSNGDIVLDAGRNGRVEMRGTIDASGVNGGSITTIAKYTLNDGVVNASGKEQGGAITTTTHYLMATDDTAVHAGGAAGNNGIWTVNADSGVTVKNVAGLKNGKFNTSQFGADGSTVSGKAVATALGNNTDVAVHANAKWDAAKNNYAADIHVKDAITKNAGDASSLTLEAGRNISVDADITSTGGALNLTMVASRQRGDGANILRANLETKGGAVTTGERLADGSVKGGNLYIGLTDAELASAAAVKGEANIGRHITTDGGNVLVQGEMIVATAGRTAIDTANGDITIIGTVNSGNAYSAKSGGNMTWDRAYNDAKALNKEVTDETADWATYLATITSQLEDSVVSASIPKLGQESYVGGKVVKVKTDENGIVVLDANGNPVIEDANAFLGTAGIKGKEKKDTVGGGWVLDTDGKSYVRYWAWVTGPEAGTIICKQTTGEWLLGGNWNNNSSYMSEHTHSTAMNPSVYTNFAPGEPNDDNGDTDKDGYGVHQTYLAVNYNTFQDKDKKDVLYSQWDDVLGLVLDKAQKINSYVVETNLPESSLDINSNNITLGGEVGGKKTLANLTLQAAGDIDAAGIKVTKAVDMTAGGSITTEGITARDNTVRMVSTGNGAITLNDKVHAGAEDTAAAVLIRTEGAFVNHAGADAVTTGTGSTWNIYSDNPEEDTFDGLDSGERAYWSWKTQDYSAGFKGNRYIFAKQPTLTISIHDASKAYGVVGTGNGYALSNSEEGDTYKGIFLDGQYGTVDSYEGYGLWDTDKKVELASKGFPAEASGGTYAIDVREDALGGRVTSYGYKIDVQPGTLSVAAAPKLIVAPEPAPEPLPQRQVQPAPAADEAGGTEVEVRKPDMFLKSTTNADGSAGYNVNNGRNGIAGVDRVAGLQNAQFPFFRLEKGTKQFYGAFDVAADPDRVKLTPSDKVLPEPPEIENQYRELTKTLTSEKGGSADFKLTYNGSRFRIIPTDEAGMAILKAGDNDKNADIASKALLAAFNEMGLALEDLDSIYVHLDGGSFRASDVSNS